MKKYIIIIIACIAVSCSDFLEGDNSSLVFDKESNKYADDINASILGVYTQMQALVEPIIVLGEVRADMIVVNGDAPSELQELSNLDYVHGNKYISKRPFYDVINACNEIYPKIDEAANKDPEMTSIIAADFKAELSGIRAWTYWQLVKLFGQIEYNGTTYSSYQLASVMLNELHDSRKGFRDTGLSADWVRSRMNKWAVSALCAQMRMSINDYDGAAKELENIMNATGDHMFKVTSTFAGDNWKNIFMAFNTSQQELIWGIDINAVYKQKNELQSFAQRYLMSNTGNLFNADAIRRKYTLTTDGRVLKYSLSSVQTTPVPEYIGATPLLAYRAADIHLLYAEVLNRMQKHAKALKFINGGDATIFTQAKGVRGRVSLGAANGKIAHADSLFVIDSILMCERARELAFEGKRWEDLARFNRYHKGILKEKMALRSLSVADKATEKIYIK